MTSALTTFSSFKWSHFAPEIILLAVRWYLRYSLSLREVEELLRERGLSVDHTAMTRRQNTDGHLLAGLRNVGPAARADFERLGISSLAQLAASDADTLYLELQRRTKQRHDPCVWDVFAAAIHQARTGEPLDWWHFTPARKVRQLRGEFPQISAAHSRPPSAPADSSLRELQPVTASSEARDG